MQKFQYLVVIFFVKLSKILPSVFLFSLFNAVGTLFFYILKPRRNLTIKNLSFAYPEKGEKDIYIFAKKCFQSVAKTAAEIMLLLNNRRQTDDFLTNKDEVLQKINEAVKGNKNGVIMLTAHFGNWEILADFMALNNFPLTVIGREGDNKLIEQNLTKPFRERNGNKNIYKKDAMRNIVKTIKNGGNVGLLIDQKAGKINSVATNFFGRKCSTTTSVANMKLMYDPLVISIFAVREKSGKYRIIFDGVIEYKAEDKQDKTDKVQAITQHYNDIIERAVRQSPEQWFWMHDRWKI